ncbi:MAG: DUF4332 domain-containing protein [Chloroflexi bacterium]|nr:DUF4332 domain-containing protein [Chloroflexota bacterium]
MQIGILWYVLAGFVLGFTVSTLWEWLYYRGRRLRGRVNVAVDVAGPVEPNAFGPTVSVGRWREPAIDRADAQDAANEPLPWATPTYRSSGVFLESEKEFATQSIPPADQFITHSFVGQPTSAPVAADAHLPTEPDGQNGILRKPNAAPVERVRAATPPVTPPAPNPPPTAPASQADAATETAEDAPTAADYAEPPITEQAEQITPWIPTPTPEPETAPALARSNGYPDDLTKIQGIGDAYKHRLYAATIYTWQQVASSEVETLRSITKAKPNARHDEWKIQAQELATKFNRLEAVYDGPVPDDLSRIDGIGPTYADTLYRAGICTYEQLAAATPAELAIILPTPAIGNEFNFASWVKQATKLAYAKQKNTNLLR